MVARIVNGAAAVLAALLTCAGAAFAQDKPANYPTRPIRLIVSVSPGAGADAIARAAAQMLIDAWGQNTVVDNRPGASGIIATELVAKSASDGYTLLSLGDTLMLLAAPRPILLAINRVVAYGMHSPQMKQRLEADGSQPAERMTPDQLKAAIMRDYVEIEQQVKQVNLKIH